MIYDTKENLQSYKGINKNLDLALDYLTKTDLSGMNAGRYEIDGEHVFALVQTPETHPQAQCRWEAHKKYIDIQYLIDGQEIIGFQKTEGMAVSEPYDAEKDIVFFEENGKGFFPRLVSGRFVVCFPTDAHKPLICADEPQPVKKVILKVEQISD
jgi:biofilm protein TabA